MTLMAEIADKVLARQKRWVDRHIVSHSYLTEKGSASGISCATTSKGWRRG